MSHRGSVQVKQTNIELRVWGQLKGPGSSGVFEALICGIASHKSANSNNTKL